MYRILKDGIEYSDYRILKEGIEFCRSYVPSTLIRSNTVCQFMILLLQYFVEICKDVFMFKSLSSNRDNMGCDVRKPIFGGLRTTKELTSLRIRAV